MYEERIYRKYMNSVGLVNFTVVEQETDLHVSAKLNLEEETKVYVKYYRKQISDYIKKNPIFLESLIPIEVEDNMPEIVKHMAWAGQMAEVGPMASVAGAISHYVGNDILKVSSEIIIENGGDLFINSINDKNVLIYAGTSPFSNNIAISIRKEKMPVGVCTSAGTIGHSLSFGNAEAVVVISKDTLLADAVATSVGNIVKTENDINSGLQFGSTINGIDGIAIIIKEKLGVWGDIQLIDINK